MSREAQGTILTLEIKVIDLHYDVLPKHIPNGFFFSLQSQAFMLNAHINNFPCLTSKLFRCNVLENIYIYKLWSGNGRIRLEHIQAGQPAEFAQAWGISQDVGLFGGKTKTIPGKPGWLVALTWSKIELPSININITAEIKCPIGCSLPIGFAYLNCTEKPYYTRK